MRQPLVERLIEAVEGRSADRFAALFAEGAIAHHPLYPEPLRGRDAIRASEKQLFDSFTDVRVDVRSVIATDEHCAVEAVLTATNTGALDLGGAEPMPATGRTIELEAVWCYDLGPDGLIVAARDYFDTAALMSQLGVGRLAASAP